MPNSGYWTMRDITYLKTYYRVLSAQEIAHVLGRTEQAVRSKANQLGLAESKPHKGLKKICRDCHYRRGTGYPYDSVQRKNLTRENSCCCYSLWEEDPCPKHPTDDDCEHFKPYVKGVNQHGK